MDRLPEVEDQTSHYPWLGGFSLWDIVEKQFTVRYHSKRSLPALLHTAGLWNLRERKQHVSLVLWNHGGTTVEPLHQCSYPNVALVRSADASLDIDALRPLGLLCWDRTDQGSMVFTGHMADEGTHCRKT